LKKMGRCRDADSESEGAQTQQPAAPASAARAMRQRWCSALALALVLAPAIDGSAGDEDPEFRSRVAACSSQCPASGAASATRRTVMLLEALQEGASWSCAEECMYIHMHAHTADRVAAGKDVLQYFGK
jgi:hypothetical protein